MDSLIYSLLAIWSYMTLWYFISILKKRDDIADIAWGIGFIIIAFLNLSIGYINPQSVTIFLLTSVWGLRLALHIYQRNKDKPEDYRYKSFKSNPYFKVFMVQGFFMLLISLPIIVISRLDITTWSDINTVGLSIWFIGFIFEVVGDLQLKQFIADPANKGKIMDQGLWRYTRHPNYFGEVTLWWGVWLISFRDLTSFLTIISPLTITILILFVSGIPLLEKKYQGNPGFEKYKSKTSPFFPLPPKK